MKKRLISTILVSLMILSLCTSVTAAGTPYSEAQVESRTTSIQQNADAFLDGSADQVALAEYIYLYDFSGNIAALYYQLDPCGYLIADYTDGHVIEYSPEAEPIKDFDSEYYYAGLLTIFEKTDNGFVNVSSGQVIQPDQIVMLASHTEEVLSEVIDYTSTYSTTALQTTYLSAPIRYIRGAEPNGYCTITAITNMLQWYHDYNGKDVYAESVSSITALRTYLHNNYYVYGAGGLDYGNAIKRHYRGGVEYAGLQSYFDRSDVDAFYANASTYNAIIVKNVINSGDPVILQIYTIALDPNHKPEDGTHSVLVYGYNDRTDALYYTINDSWGNNSVSICADDVPSSFGILYLK